MPELPEVETIRKGLEKEFAGRKIKTVDVTGMRSIRRHPNKKHFISQLEGKKLKGWSRKGKFLIANIADEYALIVHLGMSGQLRKMAAKDDKPKHTHVIFTFTQGPQLRFIDPRTFGEMFTAPWDTYATEVQEIAELGFDPVDEALPWTTFAEALVQRRTKIKTLLMDQKFMAGIGNIYSDEILYHAGLMYDRSSDSLSMQELRRLYRAVVETLHDAIKYRGSTLSDNQYVDLEGKPGDFRQYHEVYDREGEPCGAGRCNVEKAKFAGRSTFYCPCTQV